MSSIQFLASSKPFILPKEIDDYNKSGIYETGMRLSVFEADKWWCDMVKPILSMPYIYEVRGLENHYFFVYLEKYMDIGDIIELYYMPNQHWHKDYIKRVLESPEPITINVGSYTYQNQFGIYQLNPKKWVEELQHRILLTERGVTTIVNY